MTNVSILILSTILAEIQPIPDKYCLARMCVYLSKQVCNHTISRILIITLIEVTWWRHHMETFAALLAICAGNSPVTVEFPAQKPVTRSFDVFFDLRLNKRLSKQWWGWWFETPSHPLWRHCNDLFTQRSEVETKTMATCIMTMMMTTNEYYYDDGNYDDDSHCDDDDVDDVV